MCVCMCECRACVCERVYRHKQGYKHSEMRAGDMGGTRL